MLTEGDKVELLGVDVWVSEKSEWVKGWKVGLRVGKNINAKNFNN